MGSSTSSEGVAHRSLHTHDLGSSVSADGRTACHARSYTDPARSHDGVGDRGRHMGLRGMDDAGEDSPRVVLSFHAEENGNGSRNSRDEEIDPGTHDDEGCSHEAGHDAHNHPRPEGIHGDGGSENVQTARVGALLESINPW